MSVQLQIWAFLEATGIRKRSNFGCKYLGGNIRINCTVSFVTIHSGTTV